MRINFADLKNRRKIAENYAKLHRFASIPNYTCCLTCGNSRQMGIEQRANLTQNTPPKNVPCQLAPTTTHLRRFRHCFNHTLSTMDISDTLRNLLCCLPLVGALLLGGQAAHAQVPTEHNKISDPVKTAPKLVQTSDGLYKVVFEFVIADGWNVYSQHVPEYGPEYGPVPTSFVFDKGITLPANTMLAEIGKAKEGYDSNFDMVVKKYAHEVSFETEALPLLPNTTVSGTYTYMTCNETSCLPPKDITFELSYDQQQHPANN